MSIVKLSRQKLDIDEAERLIRKHIVDLQLKQRILQRGIQAIEEGEDVLDGDSILAGEVRKIMYQLSHNNILE